MDHPGRIPLRLLRLLGTGGMGQVWEARYGERLAAAKIITAHPVQGPASLEREVHAMAQLRHPNIVDIHDFGTIDDPASVGAGDDVKPGTPFFVMDLGTQGSLREWLERGEHIEWPFIRDTLLSVLAALAHAHARYMVHRDVKPDNLLGFGNRKNLTWKLTDFGIAHRIHRDLDRDFELVTGTPHYMAPEQFTADWRNHIGPTDMYAVGCIAYELTCGRPPYDSDDLRELARMHVEAPLPHFEPLVDVPDGFDDWVLTLMAKQPLARGYKAALTAAALRELDEQFSPTLRMSAKRRPAGSLRPEALESAPTLAMEMPIATAAPTVRARADGTRVPLTADWRAFEQARAKHRGVSSPRLHALRPWRFVGRELERDILWDTYVDTARSSEARCVIIEGAPGYGKSGLAKWFCEYIQEIGGANYQHAYHTEDAGHGEGMAHMAARFTRCAGLSTAELGPYLEVLLERWGVRGQWAVDVLTRFVAEAAIDYDASSRRSSQIYRPALLAKLHEQACLTQAIVTWLDDVQWNEEAVDLLDVIFAAQGPTIRALSMFVVTVDSDAVSKLPRQRAALDALAARPGVRRIVLDKLDRGALADLFTQTASIPDTTLERIIDMVDGSPLFATQLITDWIGRGVLKPHEEGFALDEAAELDLDDTLLDLWERRLDRALRGRSIDDRRALELAAVLGGSVANDEWVALCARCDVPLAADLPRLYVEQGLAHWTDDGWAFAHGMVRTSVLAGADDHLTEYHREAAHLLEEKRRAHARPGLALRVAHHLTASGELTEALDAWLAAARDQEAAGDFGGALAILEELQTSARELGDVAAQSDGLRTMSLVHMRTGKLKEAGACARSAEALARSTGDERRRGLATAQLADVCIQDGRFREALAMAEDALELLGATDDAPGIAVANLRVADCLAYMARHEEAMDRYRRAARSSDDPFHAAWADYGIGYLHLQRGEMADAERHLSRALAGYQQAGATSYAVKVTNALADHARVSGDLDAARMGYARVAAFLEGVGDAKVAVTHLNLALVAFADDDPDAAVQCLARAERSLEAMPQHHLDAAMSITALALAAHGGEWSAWDAHFAAAERHLETSGVLELDDAWLTDLAGDYTFRAGDRNRARKIFELSRGLWARLELGDRQAATERKLAAL